ncbi:MAG: hypothetical protein IKU07_01385 [Oscillospiraceae bacterium]|nr:hypothetical protein [Oscillospiraceae bacterium]
MEKTASYLIEPLLTQYFLMDAICGEYLEEDTRKNIYAELTRVFCIPDWEETDRFFRAAEEEPFKSVTDSAAYERLCRTIEFARKSGQSLELTETDRVILARKQEAMRIKTKLFDKVCNLTDDMIRDTLSNTAMNGDVDAMVMLAYMEYNGICVCRDRAGARKRLRLCAKWNHLFGNLMGIAYDPENRETYYNTLYTVLRSADRKAVFSHICRQTGYSGEPVKDPVADMLETAFGMKLMKRDTYDRSVAKIAFSQLLSAEDKEKLLLNNKPETIGALLDIPFDAKRDAGYSFDCSLASNIPLPRTEELDKVFCGIYPATGHIPGGYRPLLVAGDDEYIPEMYAEALKAGFSGSNKVIEIDAGTLTGADFAEGKENFLLRGLSETKQTHTVFLVKHCDEMGEAELEALAKLLDYGYRRKFKLLVPTVSLDLSDVLLVLFASRVNPAAKRLARECDVLWTAPITQEEKQRMIETVFESRAKSFGIGSAKLEAEGRDFLTPFKTGQIVLLLDGALKRAAFHKESVITAEALRTVSDQQSIRRNKREFGYLGGGCNEEY